MPAWIKYSLFVLFLMATIPLAMQFDSGSIQGQISDDEGGIAGARIEARRSVTGATSYAESDATGTYRLDNLRQGRYALWIQAADHSAAWIPEVVVRAGQVTSLNMQLNRISGVKVETSELPEDSGRPD